MKRLNHMLGTAIGVLMVLAFTGTIIAMVISLAIPNAPSIPELWSDLRCSAGYPSANSTCGMQIIRRAQTAQNALDRKLQDSQRSLAQALADLKKAEIARKEAEAALAGQNLVFEQGPALKDRVSLVVGTIYRDAATQTGIVRSFCWAIVDHGGLDPRVPLAVRDAQGKIKRLAISPGDLALLDMPQADIEAAVGSCPWPQGTT